MPGKSGHQQIFYFADVKGCFRTEVKLEDEGDEILTPPMFSEVRRLMRVLFRSHREPLIKGLEELSNKAEVAHEYSDILADFHDGKLGFWLSGGQSPY